MEWMEWMILTKQNSRSGVVVVVLAGGGGEAVAIKDIKESEKNKVKMLQKTNKQSQKEMS